MQMGFNTYEWFPLAPLWLHPKGIQLRTPPVRGHISQDKKSLERIVNMVPHKQLF